MDLVEIKKLYDIYFAIRIIMSKKAFSFKKKDKILKSINTFYSVSEGLMISTICQELRYIFIEFLIFIGVIRILEENLPKLFIDFTNFSSG